MKRLDSVDVMRALALIGMVICHYPIFLSRGDGADAMLYFLTNHLLGGDFAASWFVFLVGVSQVLSAQKQRAGQPANASLAIIRGAVIFVIGLLFLLIVQGSEELWDWDILTFIGAMTIVLLYCRPLPSSVLLAFCAGILFATPWLRSYADMAPLYGGGFDNVKWISDFFPNLLFDPLKDYTGAPSVIGNIAGFFLIGQFPILPWIIFPLLGFVIGRRLVDGHMAADTPFLLIIGAILSFTGLSLAYAGSLTPPFEVTSGYIVPFSFYPLSFSMILFLIGIVLILYSLVWIVFDKHPDESKEPGLFLRYCRQISKYSLTIYITHFALFFIPLRLFEWATGKSYLRDLMPTGTALALALVLMVLYYPLLKLWDKAGGKFSFEWMLANVMSILGRKAAN